MLGYLRRGGRRGWFVLKSRVLYRHAAPEDVAADDSLSVLGYSLSDQVRVHFDTRVIICVLY